MSVNLFQPPISNYINYIEDCALPEGRATVPFKVTFVGPNGAIIPLPLANQSVQGDFYLLDTSSFRQVRNLSQIKSLFMNVSFNGVGAAPDILFPTLLIFVEGSTQLYEFTPNRAVNGGSTSATLNCAIPLISNVPARIWFCATGNYEVDASGLVISANVNNFNMQPFIDWTT